MRLRNTRENWGGMAKTLHWGAAALIFAMLGLGLTMVHAGLGAGAKFEAYQLHKSTGFLVLAVMLVRGLWRVANPPPARPAGTRPWERRLAWALHRGFYALIAAMIASGWLMVSASPLPLPAHLPGGFVVPNLTGPNALLEARTKFVHEVVSKLLIAAILLHVAAALKHHFADRDTVCACCHFIMMTNADDDNLGMFEIPFSVNMNGSGQIGAGLALETRYRTID